VPDSIGLQTPSPQVLGQSCRQENESSPRGELQNPSPHQPQSSGQPQDVSPGVQTPSPQVPVEQSSVHQVASPGPQKPSPQEVQSRGHVVVVSHDSQAPFPQEKTQSEHHEELSPLPQTRSPHHPQSDGQTSPEVHSPSPQMAPQSHGHEKRSSFHEHTPSLQ